VIEFESVSKTFRDGTAAVVDLSLTAPTGKITVIVGPSGCGKTTTLRMVNRMLEPTSGRILWDGSPLRSRRRTTLRRQMGYVIQSGGLFPHRTVLENIGTVPGLLGWSKDRSRKRSLELLASVGLDRKLASRYPAQLSGGQQQRVGVARALAADPLVLLMDEPFSAVDPVVRSELHEFFLGLQREISKTIILITHDIDEAIKLGDQVAILRVGGRLAQVGTPQHLLEEPADAFVEGFIGKDRGYRSLSFLPADGLRLDRVDVVREVTAAESDEPTLVVDGEARPVGWAHRDQPGRVMPVGSTFVPETDTLRTALDSALTSPYGLAVAVAPGTGRFAGVIGAQEILAQVADARAAELSPMRPEPEGAQEEATTLPESVEGPHDEEATSPEPVEGPEDEADMRPEPVEGPQVRTSTGSTRMDELQLSPEPVTRPEPVEGPHDDAEIRPEPVEGPEDGASTGSARSSDQSVEGPGEETSTSADSTPRDPVNRSANGASDGSAHLTDEREPDADHAR
jgi:osmoprotectant transport system ATP-binding protein